MANRDDLYRQLAALLAEAVRLTHQLAHPAPSTDAEESAARSAAPPSSNPPADGAHAGAEALVGRLEAAGLRVKAVVAGGRIDPELAKLARLIADKYPNLVPLIDAIKRAQSTREMIHMDLKPYPAQQIADITLLVDLAHKAELLPAFKYRKSPVRELYCAPPVDPRAISFFTGEWLEIYAETALASCQHLAAAPILHLRRIQVTLPEGDDFELDLVALVNDRLLWIEAKTTNGFARRLPTLRRTSTHLCDQPEDAILLCAHKEALRFADALAVQARMALCTPDSLADHLRGRIRRAPDPIPSPA